jgi:hypothetical protein
MKEIGYISFSVPLQLSETLTYLSMERREQARKFRVFHVPTKTEKNGDQWQEHFLVFFDKFGKLDGNLTVAQLKKVAGIREVNVSWTNVAYSEAKESYVHVLNERTVSKAEIRTIKKGKGKEAYKPAAKTADA